VLAAAVRLGTTTVWVAFHGLGVEHDRQVNRPGAFIETCLAIQRVHGAGLRAGANVFVTTANAGQAERLLGALGRLEVDQMAWEPATYYPTHGAAATSACAPSCRSCCRWLTGFASSARSTATPGRTWRPIPRRPGWPGRRPPTGHRS
jgi:MoaA/NifB/PqqE/SkfB family radical SAM enzyme